MRASTQKLTTAAVCTAVAVVMCAASAYLPLSIMPLYLAAFCIFLACKRGNVYYGLLCAVATVGIMFAMSGLSVKWLFLAIMFVPYGIITNFIHRYTYLKVKSGIIRGVLMAVFFNVTFGIVYLIASRVLFVGIADDANISYWSSWLGGYWVLAIVATLVLLPLDFVFSTLSIVVLKRIPMPSARHSDSSVVAQNRNKPSANSSTSANRRFDIFGYEIYNDGAPNLQDGGEQQAIVEAPSNKETDSEEAQSTKEQDAPSDNQEQTDSTDKRGDAK